MFHFSRDVYLNDERHMKYLYSIFQTSWFNFQELRSREKYMYNFNNEKLHRMCLTRSRYLIKNRSYLMLQGTYNLYNSIVTIKPLPFLQSYSRHLNPSLPTHPGPEKEHAKREREKEKKRTKQTEKDYASKRDFSPT